MTNATRHPVLCVGLTPALQRTIRFSNLRVEAVNRATAVTTTAAGKAVNVARVLRTLDRMVRLTGFLGGSTGEAVRTEVEALGVETHCAVTAAPTRICQTLINERTGEVTELVEETPLPQPREWDDFMRRYAALLQGTSLVVLSGTLMPGAARDVYHDLVARAETAGIPVLIDSHGEPLTLALRAKPWLVKLNAEELEQTCNAAFNSDESLVSAARALLGEGARAVLITRGEKASVFVQGDAAHTIRPPRIDPLNPIGSGDSVAAGIVDAHLRGDPLVKAVCFGMACGAANALTEWPGHLHRTDIERIRPEMHVQPL